MLEVEGKTMKTENCRLWIRSALVIWFTSFFGKKEREPDVEMLKTWRAYDGKEMEARFDFVSKTAICNNLIVE